MSAERAEFLINALQNGGNKPKNRKEALRIIIQEIQEPKELTLEGLNDLTIALESAWRKKGRIKPSRLDTVKMSL